LRATLNSLATLDPEWLRQQVNSDWFERYGTRMDAYRLPKKKAEQQTLAETIGQDGFDLLAAIDAPQAPDWLQEVSAVKHLRQVWEHQYEQLEEKGLRWRKGKNQFSLRYRSQVQCQEVNTLVRIQGAPDRDLLAGRIAPDYEC